MVENPQVAGEIENLGIGKMRTHIGKERIIDAEMAGKKTFGVIDGNFLALAERGDKSALEPNGF